MVKRALLIGSSFSAAPLFFALKRRGLHVTVAGNLESDPCHQYADQSAFFDYSKREALLDYVKANSFDYLVPSCNDFSYVSGNWVAHELGGFPGWDTLATTLMLHTKHRFRQFCEEHGLPSPVRQFWGLPSDAPKDLEIQYPALVKPVDSFSGRGMTRLADGRGLAEALAVAAKESRTGEVVVEPFYDGTLHSHSAFVEDGAFAWDDFVDEFCTVYPYQVDCSNYPSALPGAIREKVRAAMLKLVRAAALTDGLLHTQIIVSPARDDFRIIECMRRGPGDLYGQLIERATGTPYNDMYVAKFLGARYPERPRLEPPKFVGRHTISVAEPVMGAGGFQTRLSGKEFAYIPLKNSGERLGVAPYDKLGLLFVEYETADDMHRAVPRYAEAFRVMAWEKRYG